MLTKIILENFKSIKNKTEINFKATGSEILEKTNKTESNILKGALFVGGNATGKSNVLEAIKFLLELLVLDVNIEFLTKTCFFSNKDTQLLYEFEILNKKIEYLISFSKGKNIINENLKIDNREIISRIGNSGKFKDINGETIITEHLNNTQSYIRKVYFDTRFNGYDTLSKWYEFLNNSLYVKQDRRKTLTSNSEKVDMKFYEDGGTRKVNKLLEDIGYPQYIDYTNNIKKGKMAFNFGDQKMLFFIRKNMDFVLPIILESGGNDVIANLAPCFIEVIEKNGMLIIDEFESGFHNLLEEKLIKYFMEKSQDSQLFIVSHSTNLMKTSLLRPDQIYTVDFIEKEGTKLSRVSDSKPREAQNLEKMYLSGVFDGIPEFK